MPVSVRMIPIELAKQTRKQREPGVRRLRMTEFDGYIRPLLDAGDNEAIVYEDIEEEPQKFVLSLRGAFKRANLDVTVRKRRGRNEVRAWKNPPKPPVETKKRSHSRRREAVPA